MSEIELCPHCNQLHEYVNPDPDLGKWACDPVLRFMKAGNDHEDRARERFDRKRKG